MPVKTSLVKNGGAFNKLVDTPRVVAEAQHIFLLI
jgi:hypothetical protein